MKLYEYVPLAVRTEKPLEGLERLIDGCMGLVTEIGEITTEIKRMYIYGKPLDAERKANILEEVGDVMWYIAILMDECIKPKSMLEVFPDFPTEPSELPNWDAMVLALGAHCGQICVSTQLIAQSGNIEPEVAMEMFASVGIIITRMSVLAVACDSDLGKTLDANIDKLRIRFPDAYSNEAAEGRADKAGQDARVS